MDLYAQYKKQTEEALNSTTRISSHSSLNKDLSSSQRPTPSPTSSTNNSKQQQQQFATKLPSEKSPAGSFLKEALLTGSGSSSPKISASPLAVDNMISKSVNSPKTSSNPNLPTIKSSTPVQSPTGNIQRSSGSNKTTTSRPSNDFTQHRTDQQVIHSQKSSSSSSSRPPSNTPLSSSSSTISPASRRPTTGFTSTHEQQVNIYCN